METRQIDGIRVLMPSTPEELTTAHGERGAVPRARGARPRLRAFSRDSSPGRWRRRGRPGQRVGRTNAPSTSRPVDVLGFGAVKAAFWENETDGGVYHTVTFSPLYRTEYGDWSSTTGCTRA